MTAKKKEPDPAIGRRNALKALAVAATTTAVEAGLPGSAAAQPANPPRQTHTVRRPAAAFPCRPITAKASIKNRNNFFPQTEDLGPDEMRITFMGSNPFPPRLSQAGTCIMVGDGGIKPVIVDNSDQHACRRRAELDSLSSRPVKELAKRADRGRYLGPTLLPHRIVRSELTGERERGRFCG